MLYDAVTLVASDSESYPYPFRCSQHVRRSSSWILGVAACHGCLTNGWMLRDQDSLSQTWDGQATEGESLHVLPEINAGAGVTPSPVRSGPQTEMYRKSQITYLGPA